MVKKLRAYHFHNGSGGGVLSVIQNLIEFSEKSLIENHIIYTINKDIIKHYPINEFKGVVSEQVFYYSPRWNFYYTCAQLSKLLPDKKCILITHDWLELGMASNLGLQNPIINFLHGDYEYYYKLSISHQAAIDIFIAIAGNIAIQLKALIPAREKDIYYLRFPVPSTVFNVNKCQTNNIVFIGRPTKEKGYNLLPEIDSILQRKNIFLNWHIIGENIYNAVTSENLLTIDLSGQATGMYVCQILSGTKATSLQCQFLAVTSPLACRHP